MDGDAVTTKDPHGSFVFSGPRPREQIPFLSRQEVKHRRPRASRGETDAKVVDGLCLRTSLVFSDCPTGSSAKSGVPAQNQKEVRMAKTNNYFLPDAWRPLVHAEQQRREERFSAQKRKWGSRFNRRAIELLATLAVVSASGIVVLKAASPTF